MGNVVIVEDLGDAAVELLGELKVDELVGTMSVGLRAENTSNAELRVGEEISEHADEGDGTSLSVVSSGVTEVSLRGSLEGVSGPVGQSGGVPSSTSLIALEGDLSAIGRVLLEDLLESISTLASIDSGRNTDRQLDGSVRTQNVTSVVQIRDTFNSNNAKSRSPGAAQDLISDRVDNGDGTIEEGNGLGDGISERSSASSGLLAADRGDLDRQLGDLHLSSVDVLNAVQKLTDDAEGRSGDSRTLSRVNLLKRGRKVDSKTK